MRALETPGRFSTISSVPSPLKYAGSTDRAAKTRRPNPRLRVLARRVTAATARVAVASNAPNTGRWFTARWICAEVRSIICGSSLAPSFARRAHARLPSDDMGHLLRHIRQMTDEGGGPL